MTNREEQLASITKTLKNSFPVINPINRNLLEGLFNEKKYTEIFSVMKNHMGITCRLSVKCITTKRNPSDSPATVDIPENFPLFGTSAQKNLVIKLTFYKELTDSFFVFIMAISHELSHIVLNSVAHPLKTSEEATDITAMILGYGLYYELGNTTFKEENFKRYFSKLGYLSFEEVVNVLSIIEE